MTIESYFSHCDLINPGTPQAAITISADSTAFFKSLSLVILKHTSTKALYLFSNKYIGIPTILLLPMSATFLDAIS